MKKKITLFLSLCLILSVISVVSYAVSLTAEEGTQDTFEVTATLPDDHVFTTMDKDGNIVEIDVDALEKETQKEIQEKQRLAKQGSFGNAKDIKAGVVNFKTKANAGLNTNYTEDGTNRSGYTNGYYAADGAFLGYNSDYSKVKFMQAGVIGWVNAWEVEILDYNSSTVKSVNFYRVENGNLYHYGTNNIKSNYYFLTANIGPKQSYMVDNKVYYSYDGHYFYESYETMIQDYKNGSRNKSINPSTPYYNYYQFLSHRSKTDISESVLNSVIKENVGSRNSKMLNLASAFIANQNKYGTNALLTLGVAANESAWGTSTIALDKNNLFGHGAVDTNPYWGANGYNSAADSVLYHSKIFVSEGYLDPKDATGRYYGAHLGDKSSGMNVKYASDPYWGEKAAAIAWRIDKKANSSDSYTYTIGIKNTQSNLNIRKDANTTSNILYQTKNTSHYPFIILSEVKGENVNNSTTWYKIQSDPTLSGDRNTMTQDKGEYNFNNYYAFVHSSYVNIVSKGKDTSTPDPNPTPDPDPKPEPSYKKGDVNNDGRISSLDYVLVKNHILGISKLSGNSAKAADVNADGKVSSLDYVLIKNHILGISQIK